MKATGKVHKVCEKVEGQTANGGFWEKQTLVISNLVGEKIIYQAFVFFGERKTKMLEGLKVGQLVDVAFAAESREYDDKWFTDLVGFGIRAYEVVSSVKNEAEQQAQQPTVQMPEEKGGDIF